MDNLKTFATLVLMKMHARTGSDILLKKSYFPPEVCSIRSRLSAIAAMYYSAYKTTDNAEDISELLLIGHAWLGNWKEIAGEPWLARVPVHCYRLEPLTCDYKKKKGQKEEKIKMQYMMGRGEHCTRTCRSFRVVGFQWRETAESSGTSKDNRIIRAELSLKRMSSTNKDQ